MTQEEVVGRVLDAVDRAGLPYMVVGSFASNYHGVPRMTQDADVVVDPPEEAALLALASALQADFYVSEEAAREAFRLRRMFNVIHFATGFKVDLMVRKLRPFSEEELRRRQAGDLAGRASHFASPEDTVLTKLEWARLAASGRQYRDARGVIQVQANRLDWIYLEHWAAQLGVLDLLDRARDTDDPPPELGG